MSTNDFIQVAGIIEADRPLAFKLATEDGVRWIPKSETQGVPGGELRVGLQITFEIKRRIAEKKKLLRTTIETQVEKDYRRVTKAYAGD